MHTDERAYEFRVAELAKSFGRVDIAKSLGDFRYVQPALVLLNEKQ